MMILSGEVRPTPLNILKLARMATVLTFSFADAVFSSTVANFTELLLVFTVKSKVSSSIPAGGVGGFQAASLSTGTP